MRCVFLVLKWLYVLVLVALAGVFIAEMAGASLLPNDEIGGFLFILFLIMLFFAAFKLLLQSTPQKRW